MWHYSNTHEHWKTPTSTLTQPLIVHVTTDQHEGTSESIRPLSLSWFDIRTVTDGEQEGEEGRLTLLSSETVNGRKVLTCGREEMATLSAQQGPVDAVELMGQWKHMTMLASCVRIQQKGPRS